MAEADLTGRSVRGEWQPESLPKPAPLFSWPPKLAPILKFLFGHDGLLYPKNAIYAGIAVVAWLFFTPSLARTETFAIGWIAELYLRNAALLLIVAGGLHLRLYIQRAQDQRYKYNPRWLVSNSRAFLFGNQTRDNMFWNFASGCTIWTGYEAVTLWLYANEFIPYVSWTRHPVYCVLMMVFILLLRQAHFYWTHRAFLFGNQTRDNMFWNFASGCTIWTGYEAVTLWLYANEFIPYVSWRLVLGQCKVATRHPVHKDVALLFDERQDGFAGHAVLETRRVVATDVSPTGSRCTSTPTICITRTSTSGHGRACRCTPSSTCCTCPGW